MKIRKTVLLVFSCDGCTLRDWKNLNTQELIFGMCIKTSHKIRIFPAAMSVCLSVCFHITIRELPNGFSWNLAFESLLEVCRRYVDFDSSRPNI
jgi:hypothetical protein